MAALDGTTTGTGVAASYTLPTNNCNPRFINVSDSTGCSLTRASIRAFTKQDMEDQQTKEVGMDRIIAQTKEARMVGVPQRTLTDLLLSRHANLGGGSGGNQGSVIAPFTLVPQQNIVNANYFAIVNSSGDPNDVQSGGAVTLGPQGGTLAAWTEIEGDQKDDLGSTTDETKFGDLVRAAGTHAALHGGRQLLYLTMADEAMGTVSSTATLTGYKSQLKHLGRFFLPGSFVLCENLDDASGASAQNVVFKVIESASKQDDGSGTVTGTALAYYAAVVVEPNLTKAHFEAEVIASTTNADGVTATARRAKMLKYIPRAGVITLMSNSVSDYEKYCAQGPAINPTNLIAYWAQTTRWTHKYSDEYLKALQAPLTSNWFKKFRELPLAQQRKQQEMRSERAFYNTVFYGDQINEKQTIETYTSLPVVEDPETDSGTGCVIEYKANALGLRTQLAECSKVYGGGLASSGASGALNLDVLFETIYQLKRYREAQSGNVDTIDIMTDRFTAAQVRDVMIKYYKSKYSTDVNMFVSLGQKVLDMDDSVALEYNKYYLPDQGCYMAIFTDTYFDDRVSAFHNAATTGSPAAPATAMTAALARARGRTMWLIDWSDVALNLLGTKSVKRQTNVADDQYNCVIQPNVKHYVLNSKKFEVRIGDPNRHAIIENITEACPTITVSGCDLS